MTRLSRPLLLAPLFVTMLSLGTGCEVLADYMPQVAFDRLDVQSVNWDGADANFVFTINNPNPIQVKLARFDYSLAFADVEWLSGDDPDGLVLDASGSSELALPVNIVFQDLFDVVQATRGMDTIPFGLQGSFGFDTPVGVADLPYDADGDFPALRTPTFAFKKVRVDSLDWTSARLAVDLNVDNEHASNLDFRNFDYRVKMDGTTVGTGLLADLGSVTGDSTGVLSVPLTIDFLSAGTAIYDAINSGQVNVGLAAGTDVDTPFGVIPLSIDETGNVQVGN